MRFNKEARTLIHEAHPSPATIPWPSNAPQPEPGKLYWLQNEEDAKQEKERREYSPPTCAEVMADMHNRLHPGKPKRKAKHRRRPTGRPTAGDPRIKVLDVEILEKGWEATVALYEDPDPVNHLRMKARIPAGPNPIEGYQEPTETEPEQIISKPSRARREEEEQAIKIEHKASLDRSTIMKAEQKLLDQRRKGKPGRLAKAAVDRARKRSELVSAGADV
jgi:hypothetical protein